MSLLRAVLLLCACGGLAGCVPAVELEGAPCPCESGYTCCDTQGICLPDGETCPTTLPPSSEDPCASNADCSSKEACHAWGVDDSGTLRLAGPQQCRRRCDKSPSCAASESCQLAPHDGQPLAQLSVAALCLPEQPPSGCAAWRCDACPTDRVGRTFCENNDLTGCLVSGHPKCGIICKKKLISKCDSCVDAGGIVTCDGHLVVPPCVAFACDKCPAEQVPFCDGATIRTCLRAAFGGECTELCDLDEVEVCASGCAVDSQGVATCTR